MNNQFVPNRENLARMKALLGAGQTVNDISLQLQCSLVTVYKWRHRLLEVGPYNDEAVFDRRELNQGQRKLSNAEVDGIGAELDENPFRALTKIKNDLQIDAHMSTIYKTVKKDLNLKFHKAAKKPHLNENDPHLRLEFAQNHLNIPAATWRKTIYMDEKLFSSCKDGRIGVWRPPNTR